MRQKILIADDSEMNRAILCDMLGEDYDYIEASNGVEALAALQTYQTEISLVLLDIVMPELDGFGVLAEMNRRYWIEDIPVIMISAENHSGLIERAYELGVADYIARPFDSTIVSRRVVNTILLYAKQKKLTHLVAEQIYEKERQSNLMVDILSHIVEFRNGESGLHVLHVRTLTELLLKQIALKDRNANLTKEQIEIAGMAAALHDIGKIAIPESILNKPGKLTDEEFKIMKTHSEIGSRMLSQLPMHQNEPLVKMAYEICRWHHERYDGRGYPDGLSGDEIPLPAQAVAVADVYDALTSERVYKPAFTHEKAIEMILNGECGSFSPLMMECLQDIAGDLQQELSRSTAAHTQSQEPRIIADKQARTLTAKASDRMVQLLDHERMKYNFFAAMSQEIQFEYTMASSIVSLSSWGAQKLGLSEVISNPQDNPAVTATIRPEDLRSLSDMLRSTTPEQPIVKADYPLNFDGEKRWTQFICRAIWSEDDPPRYTGAIGKAVDIHDSYVKLMHLEWKASHDTLTGLINYSFAKERISERIKQRVGSQFALAVIRIDRFQAINRQLGRAAGNKVLAHVAEQLRRNIRSGDIAACDGTNEFLVFVEYKDDLESVVERMLSSMCCEYEGQPVSVSIGVADTEHTDKDFDALLNAADRALAAAKEAGGGVCRYDRPTA